MITKLFLYRMKNSAIPYGYTEAQLIAVTQDQIDKAKSWFEQHAEPITIAQDQFFVNVKAEQAHEKPPEALL